MSESESIPIGSDIVELDSGSILSYLYSQTHTGDTLQINFDFIFDTFSTQVYFDSWKNISLPYGISNVSKIVCLLEFSNGSTVDLNGYQENVNSEWGEMLVSFDAPQGIRNKQLKFFSVIFTLDSNFSQNAFYSLGVLTLLCQDGEFESSAQS